MTDNEAYQATLARIDRDIAKAEVVLDTLRAGRVAIVNIINADAAQVPLPFPGGNGGAHTPTLPVGTTMKQAALMAMARAGRPMGLRDLYLAVRALGFPYDKDFKTFRGSMTPTLDRDGAFVKVGPGLYEPAGAAARVEI